MKSLFYILVLSLIFKNIILMNIGGGAHFEERDDVRRAISLDIVQRINQAQNSNLETKLDIVRFIIASYPLNADAGLVPEITASLNSLFSDVADKVESSTDCQLILDVAGPDVEGKSGGICGNYIFDSILNETNKGKVNKLYAKLHGENK